MRYDPIRFHPFCVQIHPKPSNMYILVGFLRPYLDMDGGESLCDILTNYTFVNFLRCLLAPFRFHALTVKST